MNNIFKFATGELSQDAFICWFFNWFNEGENPYLKKAVCDFCRDKLDISSVSSVDIYRQFSKKVTKDNTMFSVKIDVLLILNSDIAVIIEDKTFTSEHSNQILRYEEGLKIMQDQDDENKLRIEGKAYSISKIMSVYWKTGFFYDCDKYVKEKVANVVVDSDYLIELLGKYRDGSQLIEMYIQKLLDDNQWYADHAKYWGVADKSEAPGIWNSNICRHQIAQYTMMREFFPEKLWNRGYFYYIDHGSSFGRPWTEIWIYADRLGKDPKGNERFEIFWRIDTDKDGSYISLRLYKPVKGKWDEKYENFKKRAKAFVEKDGTYLWEKLDPGKTDSYKEADITHFAIEQESWEEDNGDNLKRVIRALNEDILEFAKEKYGPNAYERN